ncbi:T-cell surface antigen CD2-like [Clinocottus analis]|uniref:T-cell surface antigen CD2-like n=1 Tax=Clinocottus analis TaxID=304258 RepID=UPI0035C01D59
MKTGMKMAAVSAISVLLLCCSAISSADSKEACDLYATIGADFSVPMASRVERTYNLKWLHNDVVIFYRKGEAVINAKKSVFENGNLKLTNVATSDAGSYRPEVFSSDGKKKGDFKAQHLCVMAPAPQPSVKTDCQTDVPDVVFTCDIQGKPVKDLQFTWLQNNNVMEKENGQTLKMKKPVDQEKTHPISCKVYNLANSMTSAPVAHTCIITTSIFLKKIWGIDIWIVGAGAGVVLLLIIVVIVCCICTKRRKRLRRKEEGELRLAWTNDQQHGHPPDQPLHHHTHRAQQQQQQQQKQQQQQPAGHTGPRQQRSRQQRERQRGPGAPEHANQSIARPQAGPRRPAQVGGGPMWACGRSYSHLMRPI